MTARLTVAKDWHHTQPWAEEWALCQQCEEAAHQDYIDACEKVHEAQAWFARAQTRLAEAKNETAQAKAALDRVQAEITRPAVSYSGPVDTDG